MTKRFEEKLGQLCRKEGYHGVTVIFEQVDGGVFDFKGVVGAEGLSQLVMSAMTSHQQAAQQKAKRKKTPTA